MINQNDLDKFQDQGIVPPLRDIEQWLELYNHNKTVVDRMYAEAMGRKTVKCPHCAKRTQIGKIAAVDILLYVPSYNSYEDSQYVLDRCICTCPKCNGIMVLHQYTGPDREHWNQFPLKNFFNNVKQVRE